MEAPKLDEHIPNGYYDDLAVNQLKATDFTSLGYFHHYIGAPSVLNFVGIGLLPVSQAPNNLGDSASAGLAGEPATNI